MTDREFLILDFLSKVRAATTRQIQNMFFQNVNISISYKVLQGLIDKKYIKRKYFNIQGKKNSYVYYLDRPPGKKILQHELLITEFYIRLEKNNFEVISFEKSPIVAGIVPDAIIEFKGRNTRRTKYIFLECQLSPHDCISKYYNIKNNIKGDNFPSTLYIVTNQEIKNTQIRGLRIVIDSLDMKKLVFYFS